MIQNSIYKEISRNYERLRMDAENDRLSRQEEVYEKVPAIREIDDETAKTGIKMAKAVINKEKTSEEAAAEAKARIDALKAEKQRLLAENGYAPDYLETKYTCEKCKDTGYVDGKKCGCFSQMLLNAVHEKSGLGAAADNVSLADFDLSLYSDKPYGNAVKTPYENMKSNFETVQNFIANFGAEYKNLLFYGETGLGKTFLCTCIAKELLDEGRFVIYVTAPKLFKMIEEERFSRTDDEEPSKFLEDLMEAELLIIDDLGSEFSTILSASETFNIINTRIIDKKPTVISTNLTPSDWANHYSDRIISRLVGDYELLKFYGEDIRWKKKNR